jgi:hypothetical protein
MGRRCINILLRGKSEEFGTILYIYSLEASKDTLKIEMNNESCLAVIVFDSVVAVEWFFL